MTKKVSTFIKLTQEDPRSRELKHNLFLHRELLSDPFVTPQMVKRASLLLSQLGVRGKDVSFQSVSGVNAGWRRKTLGGNHGKHYYLWWAPNGSPPVKHLDLPDPSILIRAAREHDDTSIPLSAGELEDYKRIERAHEAERTLPEEPWTKDQLTFIQGSKPIRLLRGQPGSGKTTSLWRAVETSQAKSVLYLTWSEELALNAKLYFDVMASEETDVTTMSLSQLWREHLSEEELQVHQDGAG